jgi:predicted nucleotidyltransferase
MTAVASQPVKQQVDPGATSTVLYRQAPRLHHALSINGVRIHRNAIQDVAQRHKMTNVRVIGSVARGEPSPEDDLDLWVDYEPGASMLDLVGAEQELTEYLGLDVQIHSTGKQAFGDDVSDLGFAVPL